MDKTSNPLSLLSFKRLALPIFITLGTTAYLLYLLFKNDYSVLENLRWTNELTHIIILAFITVAIRDLAYIYRIWELSDRKLSFWRCVEVIFLWEFGSAITPASIGGISLAFYILYKEGIKPGKATSILMFSTYLDNIAFILVFSSLYFVFGNSMFDLSASCGTFGKSPSVIAFRAVGEYVWIGFLVVAFFGSLLGFAIFIRPHFATHFIKKIAATSLLYKWESNLHHIADDIHLTSLFFKDKGWPFLSKVLFATVISWSARYALANCLISGFSAFDLDQLVVFARQYVQRVIVMIPSTPGGSGIAELSFMALNCEFIKDGLSPLVALIWRGFNFYFYILMGILILPTWLSRVSKNKNTDA